MTPETVPRDVTGDNGKGAYGTMPLVKVIVGCRVPAVRGLIVGP